MPGDNVRDAGRVGIDEVRAEFAGAEGLGLGERNQEQEQSGVPEGHGFAGSTHALRAKGDTNLSKSRCQPRVRPLTSSPETTKAQTPPDTAARPASYGCLRSREIHSGRRSSSALRQTAGCSPSGDPLCRTRSRAV